MNSDIKWQTFDDISLQRVQWIILVILGNANHLYALVAVGWAQAEPPVGPEQPGGRAQAVPVLGPSHVAGGAQGGHVYIPVVLPQVSGDSNNPLNLDTESESGDLRDKFDNPGVQGIIISFQDYSFQAIAFNTISLYKYILFQTANLKKSQQLRGFPWSHQPV